MAGLLVVGGDRSAGAHPVVGELSLVARRMPRPWLRISRAHCATAIDGASARLITSTGPHSAERSRKEVAQLVMTLFAPRTEVDPRISLPTSGVIRA